MILAAAIGAGCSGPATYIDNEGGHRCYLDGVQERRPKVPFRYYGTSRIDVIPADVDGGPDWDRRPMTVAVPLPTPANPWFFPFDFLIEAVDRFLHGPGDVIATIGSPSRPTLDPGIRPPGIEAVNERAHAARIAR